MNDILTPAKIKKSDVTSALTPQNKINRLKTQIQNRTYPILDPELNARHMNPETSAQAKFIYDHIAQKLHHLKNLNTNI